MRAHVVEVETRIDLDDLAADNRLHRWRCSCGDAGAWTRRARGARDGGIKHQRAAERGATNSHVRH